MSFISNPFGGGVTIIGGSGGNETLAATLLLGDVTGASSGIFFSDGDGANLASTSKILWSDSTNPFGTQDLRARRVASGIFELDGNGNPGELVVATGHIGAALIKESETDIAYAFQAYPTTGMTTEFGGAQLSLFYNGARRLFVNGAGTNLQFGTISEYRKSVGNVSITTTPAAQNTGGVLTNIAATGIVELTVPGFPGLGNLWTFCRVEDFPLRIVPGSGGAFITPSGKLADGKYIELGNVGATVTIVSNSQFDWMVISQVGTLTSEP